MTSTPLTDNNVSDPKDLSQDSGSLSTSVRRGVVWSLGNSVALRLAGILVTAVVAHILDPRDFGVFAVATTAFAIISSIGEFGVSACLIRADLDIDALAPTMATVSVTTSAILAGLMAVFAKQIAAALGAAEAAGPIRVMALTVIMIGIIAVPTAQLTRDFKQDKIFLGNIASFVPSVIVLLLLAKSGSGALAFAWSRVAGQLASGVVIIASAPKFYHLGFARRAMSVLFAFGLPLAAANFVNFILLNADYALIGRLMGAVALGTYVLAFNVASWPASILSSVLHSVIMPAFSRVKSDTDLLRDSMASALRVLSLVIMPVCGLIMALARPLVLTLYGAKWAASADVLSVLAIYGAISLLCSLFANILASLGRTKALLVIQVIWLATLFPAMALGVRWGGITGAAFAHIAVIAPIVLPSYLFVLKRATGIHFAKLGNAILPALLASSVAALAARAAGAQFAEPLAQLIAGLAAGGAIYVVAAAPDVIMLLSRGRAPKPFEVRILRSYSTAARLIGLPGNRPKHSYKRDLWHPQQKRPQRLIGVEPGITGFTASSVNDHAEPSLIALELLMSMSKPAPVVPRSRASARKIGRPLQ